MNKLACMVSIISFVFVSTSFSKYYKSPHDVSFPISQPSILNIMTFNVKTAKTLGFSFGDWSQRMPLVFEMITDHSPDIFGLQEPVNGQLQDIQQAFPQYASYSVFGSGKTKGQTCPIFWRKDKFMLLDSGTFWFSDQPDTPGSKSWGLVVPRFCSWVKLSEKGRDTCFYIYNTHLDSISQSSRDHSVRILAKQIAARSNCSPFVIMGDFNATLSNNALEFLSKAGDENQFPVVDAWHAVHPDVTAAPTIRFGGPGSGLQFDHIQLGLGAKPLTAEVDDRKIQGRYPSDHFPVIAKIMLTAQNPPAAITKK